jgi:hypothetical protein
MDKSVKILLYVIMGIVVFQGLFTLFFSYSLLKDAVNDIKSVKSDLRNISDSLSSSRKQIGSIMDNLNRNQAKVNLMKSQVEILYLDYHSDEAKSKVKRDSLKTELHKEEEYIDSLKNQLDGLDK